jgi:hypothetical protein
MKDRQLLLPKSLVETWVYDLETEEKLEIMEVVFNWYLDNPPVEIKSRTIKLLWNNVLPTLQNYKDNYEAGKKGGAPKGNSNAKKQPPLFLETTPLELKNNPLFLETTPVVLENKPKDKDKDKDKDIDKDKDKDKNIDIDKEADKVLNELLNRYN